MSDILICKPVRSTASNLTPHRGFEDLYGIDADGCVLIRPDGHVAFRSAIGPTTPLHLRRTLREIGFEIYA
jgi:hypothetical protein